MGNDELCDSLLEACYKLKVTNNYERAMSILIQIDGINPTNYSIEANDCLSILFADGFIDKYIEHTEPLYKINERGIKFCKSETYVKNRKKLKNESLRKKGTFIIAIISIFISALALIINQKSAIKIQILQGKVQQQSQLGR